MLRAYFADMHIHIGRDLNHRPVKITAAKTLTLTNILVESSRRKGIDLVGMIDGHVPAVQQEIKQLIQEGKAKELPDGGIKFEEVTLILGSEIELYDEHCQGPIHVLTYFPTLKSIEQFSHWLTDKMTNITLSSQRYYGTAKALQFKVKELGGLFIPAHVFTPFKSLYGKGVHRSLTEVFAPDLIDGIELGLSADTEMADQIKELHHYPFLTNSDAHSLAKIAREYQQVVMKSPNFKEFKWALQDKHGRHIRKNYGLHPKLGKYFSTVCQNCYTTLTPTATLCMACGENKIVKGVNDRVKELADANKNPKKRPPYLYQVPLEYLPSLGPKTLDKLLARFNTEMNVIHMVPLEELQKVISAKLASMIIQMRHGQLTIHAGGGGKYGSVEAP